MNKISEVNFRITTASLSTSRPVRYAPDSGIINSAILHFPAGADQLVEVLVYHKTVQVLPTPAAGQGTQVGIALEDTTQSFDIREEIRRGDPLQVLVINHDDTYEHTISVVILIGPETYAGP